MAYDILDGMRYINEMGDRGRARYADRLLGEAFNASPADIMLGTRDAYRSSSLNKLMGNSFNAPTPSAQESALSKLAAAGFGREAFEARGLIEDRQHSQRQRRMERLQTRAQWLSVMPSEARASAWPSIRQDLLAQDPELMQYLPEHYDEASFGPMIQQLAGSSTRSNLTPSVASVEDAFRRGQISAEEYQKALRIALDLAPGASAPRISYVERYDPATGRTYKEPMLTSGLDYTNGAPSLANGGQSVPGGSAGYSMGGTQYQITPGPGAAEVPPSDYAALGAALTQGGTFVMGANGQPQRIPDGGSLPPQAAALEAPQGPGVLSGPGNAERAAQSEREAAAGARGRIAGERAMGPNFDDEARLRGEYDDRTKEPRTIIDAFRRVEGAASDPSAAGDLSMIFAYMKMLDPNSVVRETEFANAQNAAGVPDVVRNLWNRALSGERLNPNQRSDFLRQATKLRDQAQTRMDEAAERYRGLAPSYSMDPDRIAPAPGVAPAPRVGEVIDGYVFQGGDPADPASWEEAR